MTVGELIVRLNAFPKDADVVIDTSTDYESFDVVNRLVPGELQSGMCGSRFVPSSAWDGELNAVLLG